VELEQEQPERSVAELIQGMADLVAEPLSPGLDREALAERLRPSRFPQHLCFIGPGRPIFFEESRSFREDAAAELAPLVVATDPMRVVAVARVVMAAG
jgi:hypothetical protein